MKPPYPQFYLDGNVELQNVVDSFRDWTHRAVLRWLAITCVFFVLLLAGVTFDIPGAIVTGMLELIICASTLHVLLHRHDEYL